MGLGTDLVKVEKPQPAEVLKNLSTDHRSQTGCSIEDEIDKGNTFASLVDKVDVSDRRNDKRFEGRG